MKSTDTPRVVFGAPTLDTLVEAAAGARTRRREAEEQARDLVRQEARDRAIKLWRAQLEAVLSPFQLEVLDLAYGHDSRPFARLRYQGEEYRLRPGYGGADITCGLHIDPNILRNHPCYDLAFDDLWNDLLLVLADDVDTRALAAANRADLASDEGIPF